MGNLLLERKIQVNAWLIKARFFYTFGVFAIGVLSRILNPESVVISFWRMVWLVSIFYIMDIIFFLYYLYVEKTNSYRHVQILSLSQIIFEVLILTFIMHYLGGISSVATVFYFLPIVYSSFLFGMIGSVSTALASVLVMNVLVLLEHFGYLSHVYFYASLPAEFTNLSIALTKTSTISLFYILVGVYSGYGSKLLFKREESLSEKTDLLEVKTNLLIGREKKLSETNNQLEEEKKKISSIISNFTDPVIFINSLGEISLFNPIAGEVLGFKEATIGKKVSGADNFSLKNFAGVIKNQYSISKIKNQNLRGDDEVEEMEIDHDGAMRTYKIMTAKVCDDIGTCYGFIKVFYDLTREKRIDQMKSEFISIAAHQLRTPLAGIKWAIKMVLDGDTGNINDEQKEVLQKGYESNERIIGLVDDMLNVSRIEGDRLEYKFALNDFHPALNKVIEELRSQIENKKISLLVNIPEKLPQIYCDKDKITLAIQGLLENAVKYTPAYGHIEIQVSVLKRYIKVMIKDNGVGIPRNQQEKLFTKFFRADNARRLQADGSGLGLFIVKNIITKHGGEIAVKSKEGIGSEFTFTIPLSKKKI